MAPTVHLHAGLVQHMEDAHVDVGDLLERAVPGREHGLLSGEDGALALMLHLMAATLPLIALLLLLPLVLQSVLPSEPVLGCLVVLDEQQVKQAQETLQCVEDGGEYQAALVVPQLLAAQCCYDQRGTL